ncbi:GNAT family N-acetyltransferase [Pedomonas sp. V897]|uniref:GNAT family N-acetyltransferase n=1 Tax=Pedomonas sp. V897 TaxID=3446482 RepID=UPI003EE191D8
MVQLIDVPAGAIASVVTCLEMTERPRPKPGPVMMTLQLVPVSDPEPDWYRALFRAIGAPWLWFSRLLLDDAALRARLTAPGTLLYAVRERGADVGLLELDASVEGEVEIVFLGLLPRLTGRGAGSWLMTQALALAWARKPRRVWLHTCTLDHPRALAFYLKHGFRAYARKVEIAPDPRLTGLLPQDAAPHVPIIGETG